MKLQTLTVMGLKRLDGRVDIYNCLRLRLTEKISNGERT